MSNEVNITEIAYGTIDPGVPPLEFYYWTSGENEYNQVRVKARFFTVEPDPWLPLGDIGVVEFEPSQMNLELTRTWATVWVGADGSHSFQRNAAIQNIGDFTSAYHILLAETDN